MSDPIPKPWPLLILLTLIWIVAGTGGVSVALREASAGALGKAGEIAFDWFLQKSTRPEDLALQRQLLLKQEEEKERQADFDRKQAAIEADHRRKLEDEQAAVEEEQDKNLMRTTGSQPTYVPAGQCIFAGGQLKCAPEQQAETQTCPCFTFNGNDDYGNPTYSFYAYECTTQASGPIPECANPNQSQ